MSMNSSSNSSGSSVYSLINDCIESRITIFIFMSFTLVNTLLVPLFFVIIYLGFQQWRKQHSGSTAATISHSDFFTYNVIGLELIGLLGFYVFVCGAYTKDKTLELVGQYICSISSPGQTLFHVLTSGERYLAVVHPVIYLGLRRVEGLRIRNISTMCTWLLCFGLMGLCSLIGNSFCSPTISCILVCSLILVSFWSFSVLRILNHPSPGEVSGDRERTDQSKQRAYHTIVAILVALLLRLVGMLVCNFMFASPVLTQIHCAVGSVAVWLTMPCSLVLPLVFLQRAGKLPGFKANTKSGS